MKSQDDFKTVLERLTTCSICGLRKAHYRLYGYRCSNPEHEQMEAELPEVLKVAKRKFKRLRRDNA